MPPKPTRLESILRPCGIIWFSICCQNRLPSTTVHWQALKQAIRQNGLAALIHPAQIRDAASAKLLSISCQLQATPFLQCHELYYTYSTKLTTIPAENFIAYEDTTIVPSLVKAANGMILELGPGPGNQIHRFDSSLVQHIYGIEPNVHFRDTLDAKLGKHGLGDKYTLLSCGIEDSDVLRKEGIAEGSLDAVLCIQVLCAVRDPKIVMKEVWKLLKPGGKFIFWEHGWSRDRVTNVAQACWNPAWSTFVGCELTRNVLGDILSCGEWENPGEIEEPEEPFSLLPRIQGVLIKKKA
ncbi:hypothetical protein N7466_006019 [Penicillium verhagenii]|uniref:uncharacterized protein n=1 Tax=Penicillium verhagenii TaxID=1562060 RepID=UPI002544F79C|nr:uncharacterized protein N7466_006019 [Penicillium verhagenii]KAJ5930526.1 hypothetical protein N7466_006019 [Penicillium verhagenii]